MKDAFDAMPNSFFSDLAKPRLCGLGPGTGLLLQIIFHAVLTVLWCLWCFQLAALHPWVGSFAGATIDRESARLIEVFAQIRCFFMFLLKMKMKPKPKPNLPLGPA